MKRNNKGFTLIELLAVIVVLAIIMVIATQQVNKAVKKSRANSFVSSYKMIVKEIKSRMVMGGLYGDTSEIVCDTTTCPANYDISKDDYDMNVVATTRSGASGYDLTMTGKGKFQNMDLNSVGCPVREGSGASEVTACTGQTIKVNIDTDGRVHLIP